MKTLEFDSRRHTRMWQLYLGIGFLFCLLCGGWPPPAGGQPSDQPELFDIEITIVNGTDRQPGRAEMVQIAPFASSRRSLAEAHDVNGSVEFPDLQLEMRTQYLLHVVADGIDYYLSRRGESLIREPATIYIFSPTTAIDAVTVTGMNLVVRRQESMLQIEYITTVENRSVPQVSITPDALPLQLAFPAGVSSLKAECLRGPEPKQVGTRSGSGAEFQGLEVALIPGSTQIRVTASVPYGGELTLPVGCSLPVEKWSMLAFPSDLDVINNELEAGVTDNSQSYRRYVGPPLEGGRVLSILIGGGSGPQVAERVFTQPGSDQQGDEAGEQDSTSSAINFVPILILAGLGILIGMVVRIFRNR